MKALVFKYQEQTYLEQFISYNNFKQNHLFTKVGANEMECNHGMVILDFLYPNQI